MQPAGRLGAQRPQFVAPIGQQPQRGERIIAACWADAVAVQGGQTNGVGVMRVGLATVALGENPDPRGQLRWHVEHHLPVGEQPLR